MDFTLREFRKADFETLWHIDQQCFEPGISYSKPELAFYMGVPGAFTLVIEAQLKSKPEIIGFIVGQRHARGLGHIITIDVLPDARRAGIGSKLLNAAETRLKAAGCKSMFLETAVDNLPALQFYKRHGYYVVKTIPRYYMGRLDAFLMQKQLA